jgi:hypothetical protein
MLYSYYRWIFRCGEAFLIWFPRTSGWQWLSDREPVRTPSGRISRRWTRYQPEWEQSYLESIRKTLHDFRSHGGNGSKGGLLELILVNLLGESHICDLVHSIVGENIFSLEISMYNLMPMHFLKYNMSYSNAINYLLQYKYSFLLGNPLLFIDFLLQRPPVAELDYHYLQRFVFVDVIAPDHVLAFA